jgi:eukaryotic-like serine/threonine-protein kinase
MLGQVLLGRYKISRLLDEGGMSKIYLARQLDEGGQDVVVKVMKDGGHLNKKMLEHFRREIYIISRFAHPHAVAYCASSTTEAIGPVLVMEYLRGVDLNTLLQREGRLPPQRVGRLLAQLCDVLQTAHDQGIVHRDVKPGNLMILYPGTPQETVKLMDFGLAKMSSLFYISPDELVNFNLPAASGTPEYIAPEMVRGTDMDGRGDIYSVGVLLFEMLTGKRPFVSDDIEKLMVMHRDQPAPTFRDVGLPGLISPAIEAVVQSCLMKHPDDRPGSAWEVALAFERAVGRRLTSGRAVVRPSRTLPKVRVPPPLAVNANTSNGSPSKTIERGVVRKDYESRMPEVMVMLKLKGFISDIGAEVIESVPGMIRVHLIDSAQKQPTGLLGWMGGNRRPAAASTAPAELELHVERRNPDQPTPLTIILVLRPGGQPLNAGWEERCGKITRELQAYLMW